MTEVTDASAIPITRAIFDDEEMLAVAEVLRSGGSFRAPAWPSLSGDSWPLPVWPKR